MTVAISDSSSLAPKLDKESLARNVLGVTDVELAFYRIPIAASNFKPFHHQPSTDPDLRVTCYSRGPLELQKSLETQTFYLAGHVKSERVDWEDTSGKIAAIPDLAGSQLFIAFGPLGIGADNDQFLELRRNTSLNTIVITFGNRSKWIKSSLLKKHTSATGVVFWEFIFPEKETDLFVDQ